MATAKKKTTAKSSAKPKSKAAQKAPRRREVGAVICLFLGLFSFLGYFNISAIFIDFFCNLIKGLIGWGFFALPPALLMCAYILFFHRGKPVVSRVVCTLLIPLVIGCILHLAISGAEMPEDLMSTLWNGGIALEQGGIISGLLTIGLATFVSRIGAAIVFVLGLFFLCITMLNRQISDIWDWFKNREHVEYEAEPDSDPTLVREPAPKKRKKAHSPIDIPLDDELSKAETADLPLQVKSIEFNKTPNVKTPDKFYDVDGNEKNREEPAFLKKFDLPVDEPVSPVDIQEQEIKSEAVQRSDKIKPAEVAAESVAISKTIEEQKEEPVQEYKFPPLSLLKESKVSPRGGKDEVATNAERLSAALDSFGIDASIINVTRGPSITRYELELEAGVKLNKLTNLADDLALSLGASGVRIAPIPDKISTVGIEVPNKLVSVVALRDVIDSDAFQNAKSKLTFALGKDISGKPIVGDISKLPHLLIAGTTGSGKSVCMNSLILSILYKSRPDEVRFIMIDPKMVEFGVYNDIPHLYIPVITDPKKAAGALQWAVTEMLKRYQKFSQTGARDLNSYNKIATASDDEEDEVLPQIVVVIDELADLMLVASKEVEESICRVAQMGRASGIHLVIATQRPSADVITGLMKANIPSRIALAVSSSLESRIILDTMGAEKLVGNGDMLYSPIGLNKPQRIQGTFVSDAERENVIDFLKSLGNAQYDDGVSRAIEAAAQEKEKNTGKDTDTEDADQDELFPEAVEVVLELGQASTSMLQRKLKLGYSRAARLVDQMEEAEIIGPFEGSKPRKLLITREQWYQRMGGGALTPDDLPPFDMEGGLIPDADSEE